MDKRNRILTSLIAFSLLFASCGGGDVSIHLEYPSFPSAGADGPSGNDALSSSTNFSQKPFDPDQKADPLDGAAFVAPPQINNYGAVSFSYPLDIPAGRGGVEPQIGLSYSSSGGDGWLGIGWSLGMGAITRTTRYGPLAYDERDVFLYMGKRLVKVEGATDSEEGVYRLEIEDGSFVRLELENSGSGGVWHVYDAGGTHTIYGESLNARIYQPSDTTKTYSWQFTRSIDKNGNTLVATYDDSEYAENRVLYLEELRYTGNTNAGVSGRQWVRFYLEDRDDFYTSKAPGFIMKMDKLLSRIEVGWDDPGGLFGGGERTLWEYELSYEISPDSKRPLLKRVESDHHSTTPEFSYSEPTHTLTWQQLSNPFASDSEINPQATKYFEGDFNGDGMSDMAFFNPETGEWKLVQSHYSGSRTYPKYNGSIARFKGYSGADSIQFFKDNVTGDYNGDGKSDIAFYLTKKKEFWVAESTGSNFNYRNYGRLALNDFDPFAAEWFSGDYDGNGITDIILFDERTGKWTWMVNKGGSFVFYTFSRKFQNLFRSDYSPDSGLNSPYTFDESSAGEARDKVHWFNGDYNGDGRSDMAFYDERSGEWWVGENLPDLDNTATLPDGMTLNFTINWQLYKVFTAPEQELFANERFSGDFDGDGFSDFLLYDRDEREWILGFVKEAPTANQGKPTIDFRVFSQMPSGVEITRWLQGDFNGDGRTDIGFYSANDHKFWIGEADPDGFRYRVYSDLTYGGPSKDDVMRTPLPEEEVTIEGSELAIQQSGKVKKVSYEFDANTAEGHGEAVFPGCFRGSCTQPELLIYDKARETFYLRLQGDSVSDKDNYSYERRVAASVDADFRVLSTKALDHDSDARDDILYYTKNASTGAHNVYRIGVPSSSLTSNSFASFTSGNVTNFSIDESAWLVDDFDDTHTGDEMLILDDQAGSARFVLADSAGTVTPLTISDTNTNKLFVSGQKLFSSTGSGTDRSLRSSFQFFSGKFSGGAIADILIYDARFSRWYKGTISGTDLTITQLNDLSLPSEGAEFPAFHRAQTVNGRTGVYYTFYDASQSNPVKKLYRLLLNGSNVELRSLGGLQDGEQFSWNLYGTTSFIVYSNDSFATLAVGDYSFTRTGGSVSGYEAVSMSREDLYSDVYPFQWIQGDYNGDGKTDVGIFHLKESKWYFAMTQGEMPDVIEEVSNGIGGSYEFSYANSTSFDNTGDDDIPDMPMNYHVCVQQIVDDGVGNRVKLKYEYKNGFATSFFIDGKKESDFFGFSHFTSIDALGSKTVNEYNTTPYSDYRMNRALNGALKKSTFRGYDAREYSTSESEYTLVTISAGSENSYLVYPSHDEKTITGVLTSSTDTSYSISGYELLSKTQTTKDYYQDGVHGVFSATTTTQFETIASTNQQRPYRAVNLQGTAHEATTTYSYDARGNVSEKRVSYTGSGLDSVANRIETYEYDTYGNVTEMSDESASPVRTSEYVFDSTMHQYVVEEKVHTGSRTLTQTKEYDYEAAFGSLSEAGDYNGNKVYFSYDELGRLSKTEADTDDGKKQLAAYSYRNSYPLSAKTIFYSGGTSSDSESRVFKDGYGRHLYTIQSAMNDSGRLYTKTGKTVYDGLGRVIRQSQTAWTSDGAIDATYSAHASEKNPTLTEYDASGRVSKVTLPKGTPGEATTTITTIYNDPWEMTEVHSGGLSKTIMKNARGETLYVTESGGTENTAMGFCYDAAGNLIKRMDTNSTAISCPAVIGSSQFSGNTGDSSGNNISTWRYDAWGQLRAASDPDTGVKHMEYNAFGDMLSRSDALGRVQTYEYDNLGRMTRKVLPGTEGEVLYTYDSGEGADNALGQLVAMEDPAQKKVFSYDKRGQRKKEKRWLKEDDGEGNITLGEERVTDFTHDLLTRALTITYPESPETGARIRACYSYNSFALAETVRVDLSASGEGCSTDPEESRDIVSSVDYNEFGQVLSITYANGIGKSFSYDDRLRVAEMEYEFNDPNDESEKARIHVTYTYNELSSIAKIASTAESDSSTSNYANYNTEQNFEYDGLNRLKRAQGDTLREGSATGTVIPESYLRAYAYAANGNLTRKEIYDATTQQIVDRWDYSYTSHKATQVASTQYSGNRFEMEYDFAGNMTRKRDNANNLTKVLEYDYANRIRNVTNSSTGETLGKYSYDDQGFRVRKRALLEKEILITTSPDGEPLSEPYTETQKRIYELENANQYFSIERQLTYAGEPIDDTEYSVANVYLNGLRVSAVTPDGNARYFLTDQVDSVKVVTDVNGKATARFEYLPYGELWFEDTSTGSVSEDGQRTTPDAISPKYNSQELDQETNLYFYNARHYDPELARFVTADTVIDGEYGVAGWNRYMYVHGNPVIASDPSGNWSLFKRGSKIDPDREATVKEFGVYTESVAPTAVATAKRIESPVGGSRGDGPGNPGKWQEAAQKYDKDFEVAIAVGEKEIALYEEGVKRLTPLGWIGKAWGAGKTVGSWAINSKRGNESKVEHRTSNGQKTDIHGNKLGGSGKPQVHKVKHNTKKSAKDAARAEGNGAPVNHPSPTEGNRHYHPTKDGEKIPASTHHEY